MYNVSDAYLTAINNKTNVIDWKGTLTDKNGTKYDINVSNLVSGSLQLTHEISSSDSLEIGTFYSAELQLSLYLSIDRYKLFGGTVSMQFGLETDATQGTFEYIPLGTFVISNAVVTNGAMALTAYDYEQKFTGISELAIVDKKPYQILTSVCKAVGVDLGSTQEDVEAMTNGTEVVSIYLTGQSEDSSNEVSLKYSDIVGYVAQMLCGYAYIGNDNKLYVKAFGSTANRTIDEGWRFTLDLQDYEVQYSGLTYTDNVKQQNIVIGDSTALVMTLNANPFLQYGTDETKTARYTNILTTIQAWDITPFEATVPLDPSLGVGDIVEFTGGQAVTGKLAPITSITYLATGQMSIKCGGKNPRLKEAESTDSGYQSVINSVNQSRTVWTPFVNEKEIQIKDNDSKEIISTGFMPTTNTILLFQGQVAMMVTSTETVADKTDTEPQTTTDNDVLVRVRYILNKVEDEVFQPIETYGDGCHLLNLFYPMTNLQAGTDYTLKVLLNVIGGSVDIPAMNLQATVFGSGLGTGYKPWDGTITIEEDFTPITITTNPIEVASMSDSVKAETQRPIGSGITDTFHPITIHTNRITIAGLYDHVGSEPIIKSFTLNTMDLYKGTYDTTYVKINSNNEYTLQKAYSYEGTAQEIDSGELKVASVDTSVFESVESVGEK